MIEELEDTPRQLDLRQNTVVTVTSGEKTEDKDEGGVVMVEEEEATHSLSVLPI